MVLGDGPGARAASPPLRMRVWAAAAPSVLETGLFHAALRPVAGQRRQQEAAPVPGGVLPAARAGTQLQPTDVT